MLTCSVEWNLRFYEAFIMNDNEQNRTLYKCKKWYSIPACVDK